MPLIGRKYRGLSLRRSSLSSPPAFVVINLPPNAVPPSQGAGGSQVLLRIGLVTRRHRRPPHHLRAWKRCRRRRLRAGATAREGQASRHR